ncbi:MAG: S8 family serine peptidase, partial [Verrucomicrobiales bacterium]|nr:S8 family serine peptidase [Verrucomicrobiales bacterium]
MVSLWCAFSAAYAQTDLVAVGKHHAHPTRILARYSNLASVHSSRTTLASLGLRIAGQVASVPGLVILDEETAPGRRPKVSLQGVAPADESGQVLVARVAALRASGLFAYVQPSYVHHAFVVPDDLRFTDGTLWGLRNRGARRGKPGADIGAEAAWDITTGSTNVIVAVIDSGIRPTHRDLARQLWRNPAEVPGNGLDDDLNGYVDDVIGVNALAGSGTPSDENDHGTHVSGTIGGAANDGNEHVGVSWNVRIMTCKFLREDGFGFTDGAIECIDYAVAHGARILNCSWGGGPFEPALFDVINSVRRKGVLVVAAAGNEASDNDAVPSYPASYKLDNVIAVAAIDRFDDIAAFSNFGRTSVHLGAPGVDIFSAGAQSDSAYATFEGTSMATPHVSGVAALILAAFPDATLAEIRDRILLTTIPTPALKERTATGGRVNAYRALSAAADGILDISVDPPAESDLLSGRTVPFFVTVSDLKAVKDAVVIATVTGQAGTIAFRNDGQSPDRVPNDGIYSANIAVPNAGEALSLSFSVSAPSKVPFTGEYSYVILRRPDNDDFATAFAVNPEGALIVGSNKGATLEAREPAHALIPTAAASVWWNWVPRVAGRIFIDPAGSAFDTVLAVYTNDTLSRLQRVASADDIRLSGALKSPKKQGYLQFDAAAGMTYRIAVAGYAEGDVGAVRLRVEPGGGPDTNAPVTSIRNLTSGVVITNALDNRLVVEGTAFDPAPNASGVKEVLVRINSEIARRTSGVTNWSSTNLMRIGRNTIRVVAYDYAGNSFAAVPLTVTYRPLLSPNDDFANAIELTGLEGAVEGNNSQASKEPGEPMHGGVSGGKSIWWAYRPPVDGVLTLATSDANFDTVLALYTGDQVAALTSISSNDNAAAGSSFSRIEQPIKAGESYHIAVTGVDRSYGTLRLAYAFRPAPVFRLQVTATEGGSVRPESGLYVGGALITLQALPMENFEFERWSGSLDSNTNPLALTLEDDVEFVAH